MHLKALRTICICAILTAGIASLSEGVLAQYLLTPYEDVRQLLSSLTEVLPPELKTSDPSAQRLAWPDWITRHDRESRERLRRGDDDTLVNWLLLGTSFTKHPRALLESVPIAENLRQLVSLRVRDMISALASTDTDERKDLARQLLRGKGYRFDTVAERARLEQHLLAEVSRSVAEQQKYTIKLNATLQSRDIRDVVTGESRLFQDRGLSLDTSLMPGFAIEKALETMARQGLLRQNSVRRVVVIGPGLDIADKTSGHDFFPVQTLQPFASVDSLARLGLAKPGDIEVTTLDISDRVNDHIAAVQRRGRAGTGYEMRFSLDRGFPWTSELVNYWKNIGDRIGSEARISKPPSAGERLEVRGVEVRPQVAAAVTPMDFNVLAGKWTGPPVDLVIATNVLVYYDKFDQALAFASIEGMLRQGGFFLTNNPVVELPTSRLRSVGFVPVQYTSAEPLRIDHIFWYRRNP